MKDCIQRMTLSVKERKREKGNWRQYRLFRIILIFLRIDDIKLKKNKTKKDTYEKKTYVLAWREIK